MFKADKATSTGVFGDSFSDMLKDYEKSSVNSLRQVRI